ncbi:MAG: transglutaminase-like domain-containing protein [Rhodospirillum sp.]|nr:transglutaminase-like domain-containing protein [Rhodospirillum sp.]MCF8491404.1 transglutaminase-like domain-containing protein [Rhodospirillum sp.]MCF8501293.1 transglutaminase-like domain-containing protein [Rhodospirillum sp.]
MDSALSIRPTEFIDSDSPEVRAFVARVAPDGQGLTLRDKVVRLHDAVRDEVLYEIYGVDFSRQGLRASQVLASGRGLCIHKSIAYAAVVRSLGVPCRLVLTDVRNHLKSDALRRLVGGDVFHYHCLVALQLEGEWIKATPVFNKTLCQLCGMSPLEFDGVTDSLSQPCDAEGREFMEFIHVHGEFDEFPYEMVLEGMRAAHPNLFRPRAGRGAWRSDVSPTQAGCRASPAGG